MRKEKILILGGAFSQVPAIQYARDNGYYVITADYLPDNPGHKISHEYYNLSTIDKEKILTLAKKLKIDAISAYASDPAAPTAAYVSEKLNLIGSPYKSVKILSNKNLFREFLRENGFNTPWFIYGSNLKEIKEKYTGGKAILKPVDSSGSKGIFTICNENELKNHFHTAIDYSRSGRVILEEFIESKGPQIHGEGFVLNGEVIFLLLGDQYFSNINNLIPYSTIVPSNFHIDIMEEIHQQVKSAITRVGFKTGGINVEVIRDKKDNIYILEIGARNGGNFMPQLMKHATGFDLVEANVNAIFQKNEYSEYNKRGTGFYAQIILHADIDGIFKGVQIPNEFKNSVVDQTIYYSIGNRVNKYRNSKDVVGVLIMKIENVKSLELLKGYLQSNLWIMVEY